MATSTRTIFQGDTWPIIKGEAADDTGVLNLSTAHTLTFEAVGTPGNIIGAAVAIQPPEADPDGIHHWNWSYTLQAADTANVGVFAVYLKVVWDVPGLEVQTFGPDTLSIIAKPV